MGLFSFLNPQPGAPGPAGSDPAQAVAQARTRARRRLIGAVLLLGVGIIAFPLLFETQPRPIPVDIPIEIPRKDNVPPLAVPAPRPPVAAASVAPAAAPATPALAPPMITESKTDAGRDVPPAGEKQTRPVVKPETVAKASTPPGATAPAPPAAIDTKPAAEVAGRFVVQVGAFADPAVARDTRAKVDKLGLRTYTQDVETDAGKRIRVRLGPYASRDEADKAAAKVKGAGLPAAVLTL